MNQYIRVPKVRLVDAEGDQVGIVDTPKALDLAKEAGLDLVEVAPNAKPPVCRIMDYNKMVYEQKRRAREARKKHKTSDVKEVKMRVNIDTHDYETKMKRAMKFLENGDKLKFTIMFRGRQMDHPELGQSIIKNILDDMKDIAEVEGSLPRHGRIMSFYMTKKN